MKTSGSRATPVFPPQDYHVGWICALPLERAAAEQMLDVPEHSHLPQDHLDSNIYTLGSIAGHNIVIACLPVGQTGISSAATVASHMRCKFPVIHFVLIVGIGGGVPGTDEDVRLGDVVISQPSDCHGGVIQYDLGKTTSSGSLRTGSLNAPPPVLLNALGKLQSNTMRKRTRISTHLSVFENMPEFTTTGLGPDVLYDASYQHNFGKSCNSCDASKIRPRAPRVNQDIVIHYGTIASGNQVMKDGKQRDELSAKLGGVLCFETEAAGLMNSFPCLVIRGICDYADSHKNDRYQPYAAAVASACAREILTITPPVRRRKMMGLAWGWSFLCFLIQLFLP